MQAAIEANAAGEDEGLDDDGAGVEDLGLAARRARVSAEITQSQALLARLDQGVAILTATILRADETLAIVSEM